MKDNRSYEIKKILQKNYPNEKFSVRISNYSLGETIHVYTTALTEQLGQPDAVWRVRANANPTQTDYEEAKKYDETFECNKQIEEAMRRLIGHNEKIDTDEHGDILSGGNTFLEFYAIKQKRWNDGNNKQI